jgi:hypothetical protein
MKKKIDKDIEKLKSKRFLNVQEQNILKKHDIMSEAKYWRQEGLPNAINEIFIKNKIDPRTSIIINYEQDFPGCNTDQGIILTSCRRFYEFEADLNEDSTKVLELYTWREITESYIIKDHEKGIGKTFGHLALEVLNELNEKPDLNK